MGIWDAVLGQHLKSHVLLGNPKAIRSDEWAIHTPAILSQCNISSSFPTQNYSLGGYKAPLVMNVPVKHFSMLLRPQFWLFFVAGTERAFAFYWNMKLVFLMGGVFLLLMLILENHFFLSLFGALWVYFSGYIQWWYSSPQMWPELVGCFALFTAAFIQILISRRKVTIALFSFVFLISSFNFIVFLYPPHQVPLLYLSGFILMGVLLPRFRSILSDLLKNRFRLVCLIITLVLTAGLLYLFFYDAKQTMDVLANTFYPGRRRTTGGGISVAQIFNGFFGIFMSEKNYPKALYNICESSNFFLFFPVPMMLMGWKWLQRKKVSTLEIALAVYHAVVLIWLIWGFPKAIAQLTLFDRVLACRSLMSLGIASIIWTCLFLHRMAKENEDYTLKLKIGISAMMLMGVLIHAFYFNTVTNGFASVSQILMISAFVTVASFLLVGRKIPFFAGLILIPNILAFSLVNPVCIGLKPILENHLYKRICQIVRQEPDSKWIVYNMPVPLLANLTYASGAHVFNGLKYVPNLDEMQKLSSMKRDLEVYNRYGYIALSLVKGLEINFHLSDKEDVYVISADPENDCWKQLGINYCMLCSPKGVYFYRYQSKT